MALSLQEVTADVKPYFDMSKFSGFESVFKSFESEFGEIKQKFDVLDKNTIENEVLGNFDDNLTDFEETERKLKSNCFFEKTSQKFLSNAFKKIKDLNPIISKKRRFVVEITEKQESESQQKFVETICLEIENAMRKIVELEKLIGVKGENSTYGPNNSILKRITIFLKKMVFSMNFADKQFSESQEGVDLFEKFQKKDNETKEKMEEYTTGKFYKPEEEDLVG